MLSTKKSLSQVFLICAVIICGIPNTQVTAVTVGKVDATSLFMSAEDPTNSNLGTQSVNLYSGQHIESFPLLSLPGRGGLGISVVLQYNGNLGHIAKAENRISQVSPFGLGFSLARQSIAVDHGGTVYLSDDKYKLLIGNSVLDLIELDSIKYMTQRGDPWEITRTVNTIGGRKYTVGWTIVREDGTVYKFGDFVLHKDSLNATRNIFHFGDYVGIGVTKKDSLYPHQWDLQRIEDTEGLHWVDFQYLRDSATFKVIDPTDDTLTVPTQHTYTRASLLDRVTMSDSSSITFAYKKRLDYQQFLGVNNYEFYDTSRIFEIRTRNANDFVLSRIRFKYDYLNDNRDSTLKKSILTNITSFDSSGIKNLPSVRLEYYTDPTSASYGCIQRVTYPSGAIKEINYDIVPDVSTFAKLDYQIQDSAFRGGGASGGPEASFAGNLFAKELPGDTVLLGVWDGHWDTFKFGMDSTVNKVVAAEGLWAVVHFGYSRVAVCRWKGGFWVVDTLPDLIPQYGSINHLVTGPDCFLVTGGTAANKIKRAAFFAWNGSIWKSKLILETSGDWEYGDGVIPLVANQLCAISFRDGTSFSNLVYAKYDHRGDSIVAGVFGAMPGVALNRLTLSTDLIAWVVEDTASINSGDQILYYNRWQDSAFSGWSKLNNFHDDFDFSRLIPLNNGFVWSHSCGLGDCPRLKSFHFDGSSMGVKQTTYTLPNQWGYTIFDLFPGGGTHSIGTRYQTGNNNIWTWTGYRFEGKQSPGQSSTLDIYLAGNAYYYGGSKIGRYRGGDDFWGPLQSIPPLYGQPSDTTAAATQDFLAGYRRPKVADTIYDTSLIYQWLSYYDDSLYEERIIRTSKYYQKLGVCPDKYDSSIIKKYYFASGNSFCEIQVWNRQICFNPVDRWTDAYVNVVVDSLFSGKAPLVAVSSVKIYNGPDDTDPIVTTYAYYGGILDQQGNTPRFARTTVSTPHFASGSANGYSVSCFYNDINDSSVVKFYDEAVYDSMSFPNLSDSNWYSIPNGGYRLDGVQYCQYTYDASDPGNVIDSSFFYYSLAAPPESLYNVYRVRLDSVSSYSEGLTSWSYNFYDDSTGLVTSTKSQISSDKHFAIDSTEYAFKVKDSIKTDHALTLPFEQVSFVVDSLNDSTVISRSQIFYEKKGSWRPQKTFAWPNASSSDTSDAIKTFETMSTLAQTYDSVGNLINSKDAMGIVTALKFDNTAGRILATGINCISQELLVQDFEQGDGWDDWNLVLYKSDVALSLTEAFTGSSSIEMIDLNIVDGLKVRGPARRILADSLTDSLYYISYWVKANTDAFLYVWPMNSVDSILDYMIVDYDAPSPSSNPQWVRVDTVLTIRDTYGSHTMTHVDILIGVYNAPFDTNYVYMDDIRFHPLKAHVNTTVYDPVTKLAVASAGPNNIPSRSEYDKFYRPTTTCNFQWDTLVSSEYSKPLTYDSLGVKLVGPYTGIIDDTTLIYVDGYIHYTLTVMAPVGNSYAKICLNNVLKRQLSCIGGCTETSIIDSFWAEAGDTLQTYVDLTDAAGEATSFATFRSLLASFRIYEETDPNFIKSILYRQSADTTVDSTVTIGYSDALGRSLQIRSTNIIDSTVRAFVTGVAEYDARGRAIKQYRPYYDIEGTATGVDDYSVFDTAVAEVNRYYDGDPGPDCNNIAYSESEFASDLRARLTKSAGPSNLYKLIGGKITNVSYSVDLINDLFTTTTYDRDSVLSRHIQDRWGLFTKSVAYYNDTTDKITTITSSNLVGDTSWVRIDTGNGTEIDLKRSETDDLGRGTLTWSRGYGSIRMLYDNAGRLRFMENELRDSLGEYVYFKYDDFGRKIEEGLVTDSTTYSQANADDVDFPALADSAITQVKYRWFYDYLPGQAPSGGIGKLVRTENVDSSYFKEFFYDPENFNDSVFIKLPIPGSAIKKVVHINNFDGSRKQRLIYPDSSTSSGSRVFVYLYDEAGRLKELVKGPPPLDTSKYAVYEYNADGSLARELLGLYKNVLLEIDDTVQVIDYSYSPLGQLIAINDNASVVGSGSGGGAANDHFGQEMVFYDGTASTYANGRPAWLKYSHSTTGGTKKTLRYDYTYNELGWLLLADDTGGAAYDRRYTYNALGHRDSLIDSIAVTSYDYDSNWRFLGFNGVTAKRCKYDKIGNLVEDSSRSIYLQTYDYRNLLTQAQIAASAGAGAYDTLTMSYDQTHRRIKKIHSWNLWEPCGGPPPPQMGPGGPDSCLTYTKTEIYYLYDEGLLLATFNDNDNVVDMFVNGPSGRIATYRSNNDFSLFYYLNDHLSSARVLLTDGSNPSMISFTDYHPFGGTQEAWYSAFNNRYKFTAKERDEHSTFDFHYFGARYYDTRIGQFASFDKASQFPGGYRYGNNPIIGVDRDGNLFGLGLLLTAAILATADATVAEIAGQNQGSFFEKWISSFAMNLVTASIINADPIGQLGNISDKAGKAAPLVKGAYYAGRTGQYAGAFVTATNTFFKAAQGDLDGAYFSWRLRDLNQIVSGAGFVDFYVSVVPSLFPGIQTPSIPRPAVYTDERGFNMAMVFKGGISGTVLSARAVVIGSNIFIDDNKWDALTKLERDVLMRHEFEHVYQYSQYGPSLVGLWVLESFDGSVPVPMDRFSIEYEAWFRSGGGNWFEYEAYLAGIRLRDFGLENTPHYGFWPW